MEFAGLRAQAGKQLQLVSHGSDPVRLQAAPCVNCTKTETRQRSNTLEFRVWGLGFRGECKVLGLGFCCQGLSGL